MSLTTVTLIADVPDSLSGPAVQAAAVAFAQTFAESVEGAAVASCTVDGLDVLPSPRDEYNAARDALNALSTGTPKAADVKAAVARLDAAARAFEASLSLPTPPDVAPATVSDDPDVAPVTVDTPPPPVEQANPAAAAAEAATTVALPEEPVA